MVTWVLYLCIGVVIGGMAGFYFAKLDDFSKKQKQELEEKLQKAEHELVDYKDEVTSHFMETANLVNNMTESYQKVHEHLAQGSVKLCNNAVEVNKLAVSPNRLAKNEINENHDEDLAELAKSKEAPKTSAESANNNNNLESNLNNNSNNDVTERDVTEIDVTERNVTKNGAAGAQAETPADSQISSIDPALEETLAHISSNTSSATSTSDTSSNTTNSSDENTARSEQHLASEEDINDPTRVLETMAVADEDAESDSDKGKSDKESKSKNRIPGSRMVH